MSGPYRCHPRCGRNGRTGDGRDTSPCRPCPYLAVDLASDELSLAAAGLAAADFLARSAAAGLLAVLSLPNAAANLKFSLSLSVVPLPALEWLLLPIVIAVLRPRLISRIG